MTDAKKPTRNRGAVIASAAPLLLPLGIAAAMITDAELRLGATESFAMLALTTLLQSLGPLALLALLMPSMAVALALVGGTLWAVWLRFVHRTRLGRAHWAWYFVGSFVWCVAGIITYGAGSTAST